MLRILASILAVLGIGAAQAPASSKQPAADQVISDMRTLVFAIRPDEIGISPATYPRKVWGVMMETGTDRGFYTLVTLADGTTSLYFSTGGGVIGAGGHESVRTASQTFLSTADDWIGSAKPIDSYPPPAAGQTTFYFLTFDGTLTYSAEEAELGKGRDELSDFFHAGQAVIAAIRETRSLDSR
jgi:hypothetical protein